MTLNDVVTPIEIVTYSAEEGTVNGHTVTRGAYATIHDACIALTVPYAQQVGGPILTHAVDTIGPPAEYWLHVHPDGQATPVPRHVPAAPAPPTAGALEVVPPQAGPVQAPVTALPPLSLPRLTLPEFSVPAFHAPEYPSFDEPEPVPPTEEALTELAERVDEVAASATDVTQQVSVADIAALDPGAVGAPAVDAPAVDAAASDAAGPEPVEDAATVGATQDHTPQDPTPQDHTPHVLTPAADEHAEAETPPDGPTLHSAREPFRSDPALLEEAWAPEPVAPTRSARRHAAGDQDPDRSSEVPLLTPSPTTGRHVTQLPEAPPSEMPAFALPPPAPMPAASPTPSPRPFLPPTPELPATAVSLPPPPPLAVAPATAAPGPLVIPTLDDLLATRPPLPTGPAQLGWRAALRQLTGGLISLRPNQAEVAHRQAIAAVQRSLTGPKTVVVINPKGGANKTTATLLIAATFGIHRGGYTLAWDNNETRGTMGWRARQGRHTNTAVDLLRELDRFDDARSVRVGDLDNFVRGQGSAQFDVLASDEDATSAASIDADAFNALHHSLSRFYRIIVVDTGNNMRASNWDAALDAADQIVIVSTIREDTAQSAAWVADALNEKGYRDKVAGAVTVLASPGVKPDPALTSRLRDHFGRLTRSVVQVPYDPALVAGGPIDIEALSSASRDAWLQATAQVADGL